MADGEGRKEGLQFWPGTLHCSWDAISLPHPQPSAGPLPPQLFQEIADATPASTSAAHSRFPRLVGTMHPPVSSCRQR